MDQYQKNVQTLRRCQLHYDAMTPPEYPDYTCPECDTEVIPDRDGVKCPNCGWSAHPDCE
jgi:Zn finger protein HypA/HybF involved in hydrogenase expression